MDVNEWISYEYSDEGTYIILRTFLTHLLVHMRQKKKIAAKITSVHGPNLVKNIYPLNSPENLTKTPQIPGYFGRNVKPPKIHMCFFTVMHGTMLSACSVARLSMNPVQYLQYPIV
jgi:hypothetical protein